jgi:hypothetical protein
MTAALLLTVLSAVLAPDGSATAHSFSDEDCLPPVRHSVMLLHLRWPLQCTVRQLASTYASVVCVYNLLGHISRAVLPRSACAPSSFIRGVDGIADGARRDCVLAPRLSRAVFFLR